MCKCCEIKYADAICPDADFCFGVEAEQKGTQFSIEPFASVGYPAILYYDYEKDNQGFYHNWGSVPINFCPWCGRDLRIN